MGMRGQGMSKSKLAILKDEIVRLEPTITPDDPSYTTYLILLSSAIVGPNIKKIAKFAHIPRKDVRERAVNLRKNKVWVGGHVYAEWFEKDGGIAFICDALVADGLVKRAEVGKEKE